MTPPRERSYAEARAHVLAAARPLPRIPVPLDRLAGTALREAIDAPHPLPPFDNSAMDGFAVRATDLADASALHPVTLAVVDVLPAGTATARALGAGEAARIMTGAIIPPGADAVVRFEDCEALPAGAAARPGVSEPAEASRVVAALAEPAGAQARFTMAPRIGDHIRRAGVDVAAGARVLRPGRELTPYDVALIAALGRTAALAGPAPRVAIVSTGDELLDPGAPLAPGRIRDSNAVMLAALVRAAGGQVVSVERASDDPADVAGRLARATLRGDVTLSIGGVSAGDFDPVKASLAAVPGAEAWRVAMKPGRPQVFGARDGRLFFGLPGNPASVACVFESLVRPALRRLQGFARLDRPRVRVRAAEAIESRAGRTDFVRARLDWQDGAWWAEPAGPQVSGHLLPQSEADALLVIGAERPGLEPGDFAAALVLRWPEPRR